MAKTPINRNRKIKAKGRYAAVNELRMYYESHATGRPLVLLHGAFGSIKTEFGKVLSTFAKTRRVIAVELQAHAHTGDPDGSLTYEQMADDVSALLGRLKVEAADFYGYSVGGGVALQVAKRHQALTRKVVFAGGASFGPTASISKCSSSRT